MSIGVNLRVTGHTSIGGRKYQEDFFSVAYQQTENDQTLEYAYFGIYDGHGGAEASLYAKEHLMNTIVSQKQFWSENDEDVLKSIREGYIQTHYAMWREQDKWPKTSSGLPSTAGTTASIAFIRRGKIYIGHVGDSGIVLGYQKDKDSSHDDGGNHRWVASRLTEDHKPESYAEKMRIMSCGGKVVTKSGVPRVVWNRPRIGHKGPVRRSTPIDEIPFLAVARSLGDLWSYNSAVDEFIVSPVPDVSVIEIDPKKFRCLIFGTDGLWNVLSAKSAVEIVRHTEMENIRIALEGGNEWKNPSKQLVNEALERWSRSNMKADNTSVVIIMLDPPGPPKRDVLKSVKSTIEHAAPEYCSASGDNNGNNDVFDLFDCIARGEATPASALPEPVPAMRYHYRHHVHHHHQHYQQHQQQLHHYHHHHHHHDYQETHHHQQHHHHHHHREPMDHYESDQSNHNYDANHHPHHQHHHHLPEQQYCHPGPSTSYHQDLVTYTDTSFAESYNSLLNRSFENTDHSYTTLFHPTDDDHTIGHEDGPSATYKNTATPVDITGHPGALVEDDDEAIIDYAPESDDETSGVGAELTRNDSTYSLTNLQTKSERLRAAMIESVPSSSQHYYHSKDGGGGGGGGGGYSGGNLAIIEHFHNYHHPLPHDQYGGGGTSSGSHTSGVVMGTDQNQHLQLQQQHQHQHQHLPPMYRMESEHQYHQHLYGVGESYEENAYHHATTSYQMERYDYRHPTNNNSSLGCEPSCSTGSGPSKMKTAAAAAAAAAVPVYDYTNTYGQQGRESGVELVQPAETFVEDLIVEEAEDEDENEMVEESEPRTAGNDVRRIQINEISSSYARASMSDGEGQPEASGDEENNASSTTQQLVVVPALAKPRVIKKTGTSATPARVITIFYETRSSRRRPRSRNPTTSGSLLSQRIVAGTGSNSSSSSSRSMLGTSSLSRIATKRRKPPTLIQSAISRSATTVGSAPTTVTIERRVLRSNGMNTTFVKPPLLSVPARPTVVLRPRADLRPQLMAPSFSVSSTTSSTTLERGRSTLHHGKVLPVPPAGRRTTMHLRRTTQ